jgi:hypothetical protein
MIGTSGQRSCASTTHCEPTRLAKWTRPDSIRCLKRGRNPCMRRTTVTHDGGVSTHKGGLLHPRESPSDRVTRDKDSPGWRRVAPTLCLTLSRESGVSTEKPIRMTCAFEYASGRNRS